MKKNTIEIIILVSLLIFSGSKVISQCFNYYKEDNYNKSITCNYQEVSNLINESETVQSNEIDNIDLEYSKNKELFESLYSRNSDFYGWININGTKVNYPFVKTVNNDYYLTRNIDKEKSSSGTIFADYRADLNDSKNFILYGHNMKNGTMFNNIVKFKENIKDNNIITIETDTNIYIYQVFSAYYTDTNFNYLKTDFESNSDYEVFLKDIKNKSIQKSDIEVTSNDKIITLSTCSYEFKNARYGFKDARTAVHGKLIKTIIK